MKKHKNAKRISIRGLLLAYLSIITLVSTGMSFARYTTSVDSVGQARVAAFRVSSTLADGEYELDTTEGEGSYTHSFTVTNESEVAVGCSLTVSGIPGGVSAKVKLGGAEIGNVSNGSPLVIGSLGPGATSANIELSFSAAQESEFEAAISVRLDAVQAD